MARINLINDTTESMELTDLIPAYAMNKEELDDYKSICESQSNIIKQMMREQNIPSITVNDYKATVSVSNRDKFDEDALLTYAKNNKEFKSVIKTKEYVDMSALEDAIYRNEISQESLAELSKFKQTTEVVSLRLSKSKKRRVKNNVH